MEQLTQRKKGHFLALAFAIPVLGVLGVMLVSGYTPFGKYSMLYSDMYHQYFPFFKAFRSALLSGESLLWSWNVGMGMDYLGLISYYLASPLNLLSVLVPESGLLVYFSLLVPIKLGLSSLFFAIFLKKCFGRNDLSVSLFGACYGLCAWALGYQWNIMWLDTFALLPLVALGAISLLKEKRFFLYTLTLFLSIYSNYYIGFFTCIFVFLLFFCYQISQCRSVGRFFGDLCRIALFSAIAIGMTAILELPALAALQTTQSSVNQFPEGFRLNIADENTWLGLLDAMRQVAGQLGGGLEPSFKEGLPNLYCGVGTLALAFLYLLQRKEKLRDKVLSVGLLLFFMVSFIIRQLDYIWHGFHFTNMIPYRFSFLYSFVVLVMAYRAWLKRRQFKLWQIITAGGLSVGIFMCSDKRTDPIYLAYNLILLGLYLAVMLYDQECKPAPAQPDREVRAAYLRERLTRRNKAGLLCAGLVGLELTVNLVNWGCWFPGTSVTNYPKGTTYSASMIRYMQEREKNTLFYRAEVTHTQTLNDGALNGYNGISTFTSSANVSVTKFMQALGYGARNTYNRYCFEESSPVSNLFLNLKYMIERDGDLEENPYFDEIHHYGDVYLLQNNAYLPLGFLAQSELADLTFTATGNRFAFQNDLIEAATGLNETVWQFLNVDDLTITATDAVLNNENSSGYCTYTTEDVAGTILYTYELSKGGFLCIDLNLSAKNGYTVSKNGVELFREGYSLPQMIAVCQVEPGDQIQILLSTKKNQEGNITIRTALLKEEVFRRAYDILNASALELTEFSNTRVAGTIDCNRDGLLYTSIPQDGNWKATVDGQEAEIKLVGDAMVAVELTEGSHTVTFTYENRAFELGWKISLGSALLFAALTAFYYRPKPRKKGKYEK